MINSDSLAQLIDRLLDGWMQLVGDDREGLSDWNGRTEAQVATIMTLTAHVHSTAMILRPALPDALTIAHMPLVRSIFESTITVGWCDKVARPHRPTRRPARHGRRVRPDLLDHGLTGTNRDRPGLREALAACRAGDTLVVTKLDRLARSLPDARAIADELTTPQISLSLGGSVYDPTDAVGRLLFNVLAMVAEFESDLIRLRTREGMRVAKAKGRLRGKQPKLNRRQEAHLVSLVHSGEYSTAEVAELFGVGRSTVYRAIERQRLDARAGLAEAISRH